MKKPRTNGDTIQWIKAKEPFQVNTIFGENKGRLYVVYSYGYHFPMYVYDRDLCTWFYHNDTYSRTTSKHQNITRPEDLDRMTLLEFEDIQAMIEARSYAGYVANRMTRNHQQRRHAA